MALGAIVAASIRRRRQLQIEEENMAQYARDELDNDWEFKIIRAYQPVFRNSEILKKLLAEEAQAGWVMIEKFDNSRVRFKRRRVQAQENILVTGIDPYRTEYGKPPDLALLVIVAIVGSRHWVRDMGFYKIEEKG